MFDVFGIGRLLIGKVKVIGHSWIKMSGANSRTSGDGGRLTRVLEDYFNGKTIGKRKRAGIANGHIGSQLMFRSFARVSRDMLGLPPKAGCVERKRYRSTHQPYRSQRDPKVWPVICWLISFRARSVDICRHTIHRAFEAIFVEFVAFGLLSYELGVTVLGGIITWPTR